MALCWIAAFAQLDGELVIAPERYSSKRAVQSAEMQNTVALSDIATLSRSTVNTGLRNLADKEFIVLDTTHAVEGKILFRGKSVKGSEVRSVKRPLRVGNVIVSRLRTYLRQIAVVDETLLQRYGVHAVCSTEFYILEPLDPAQDIAFLVPFLLSEPVQDIFKHSQEGGHHPRMHESVLMELRVPRSLLGVREQISEQVRQFIQSIRQGESLYEECSKQVAGLAGK